MKEFQLIGSTEGLRQSSTDPHRVMNDLSHSMIFLYLSISSLLQDYFFGAFDTIDPRKKTSQGQHRTTSFQPERVHGTASADFEDIDKDWPQSSEAIFDIISRLSATSEFEYLNEYNRLKPVRPKGDTVHGR